MRLFLRVLFLIHAAQSSAQNLPKGVGALQYGYRRYLYNGTMFGDHGEQVAIGDRYQRNLNGENLLKGDGGADLERLAKEIDQIDPNAKSGDRLLERLELGQLSAKVSQSVDAQHLGFGYGLTSRWTGYLGLPFIRAQTNADVSYQSKNNALDLKEELGDLAYDELSEGLEKASKVSSKQVMNALSEYDYAPLGSWQRQGIGDTRVGATTQTQKRFAYGFSILQQFDLNLNIPTGYVEDPDILQDINFGDGYWSSGFLAKETIWWNRRLGLSTSASYRHGYSTIIRKRVPEAGKEGLVRSDRSTEVELTPGDEGDLYFSGLVSQWWLVFEARRGVRRHYRDRFQGSLPGNYAALEQGSDKTQHFSLYSLTLDTIDAYSKSRIKLPFLLSLSWFDTLAAKNAVAERYLEITMTSFFAPKVR